MRRGLAAVLLALAISSSVSVARTGSPRDSCTSAGAKTVLGTSVLRVFRTPLVKARRLPGVHVDSVYACWRSTGRRTRLVQESPDDDGSLRLDSVAQPDTGDSPLAGFVTTLITRSGATDAIPSLNVKTGRILAANTPDVRAYELSETGLAIQEFLITPAGALAWIGQGDCPGSLDFASDGISGVYAIDEGQPEHAEQCGTAGGDLGPGSGPAEFAGLRYIDPGAQLSWLSRTGLQTATLSSR